jgi:hypothetical protein
MGIALATGSGIDASGGYVVLGLNHRNFDRSLAGVDIELLAPDNSVTFPLSPIHPDLPLLMVQQANHRRRFSN